MLLGLGIVLPAAGAGALTTTASRAAGAPAHAGVAPRTLPAAQTFTYTGSEQTYTVPAGVALVGIDAIGASGGAGPIGAGGVGETVTSYLPVTPREVLYTEVGQDGSTGGGATIGGGGASGAQSDGLQVAGSGGGASDVRSCSKHAASCKGGGTSLASRIVVAGGGGGGGGLGTAEDVVCGGGEFAGGANTGGPIQTFAAGSFIDGGNDSSTAPSTQATGGTGTAVGGGGLDADCTVNTESFPGGVAGTSGAGPSGGTGGSASGNEGAGGGGGGGYYGAGGGSSGQTCTTSPASCTWGTNGSGGGGGSSFVSKAAWIGSPLIIGGSESPPSVTFTPIISITAPASGATYTLGQTVDAAFECNPLETGICTGAVANGSPIAMSTVGTHTFVVQGGISGIAVTGTVTYHVKRSSKTTLSCKPAAVKAGHATKCTVSVSDTSAKGTAITPKGIVGFSAVGAGKFSKTTCTLKKTSATSASCSTSYTPEKSGTRDVKGAYGGDTVHLASAGSFKVKITK
jgi:hypothetical protein